MKRTSATAKKFAEKENLARKKENAKVPKTKETVYAYVIRGLRRGSLHVFVVWLLEEEVRGELFVLVTCKVGLDCLVARET